MLTIEQLATPPAQTATGQAPQQLGQEDFLELLVTQLKNQDPSNPVENAEFLGQIAQFNMVSGIDQLNDSFGGIEAGLFTGQAMQASNLIGRQVLIATEPERVYETVESVSVDRVNARIELHLANGETIGLSQVSEFK